jgi:hypothetical protein
LIPTRIFIGELARRKEGSMWLKNKNDHMKPICSIILLFVNIQMLHAQDTIGKTINYDWASKSNDLHAKITIKSPTNFIGGKTALYYITLQDTLQESNIDSSYIAICNTVPAATTVFQIRLLLKNDTLSNPIFLQLAKHFVDDLIPDITKQFPQFICKDVVLAGTNESAVIAFCCASIAPNTFNRTALFFNDYAPGFALSKQFDSLANQLKGKLYLQVSNNENQFNTIDYMANVMALKSAVMLFKIDEENTNDIEMDFKEGYNWLMAKGHNFIINTDF